MLPFFPRILSIYMFSLKLLRIWSFLFLILNVTFAKAFLLRKGYFLLWGGLQTGKSPGSDGLPWEFYLAFWDSLGNALLSVLNECFQAGLLAPSQHEGLLHLIFKRDDLRLAKNWQPISLLNTDYKIAS